MWIFQTDLTIRADELARAVEERGFESLFLPEHTHIPVSRRTPWPGGGDMPRQYWHLLDPFVGLSMAAAATTRLKLGTGICLLVQRDPIITAKQVASLDVLSHGRLLFGVGGGWNREEVENHGTRFSSRHRLLRERVLAMKEIWTKDEAEFHGEFVDFDPIWSYPKPVQKPHPPVLMGGESANTPQRVVDYCEGWLPRPKRPGSQDILEGIADLRRRAEEAGRAPSSISVSVFGAGQVTSARPLPGAAMGVKPDEAALDDYAAAGVTRVIFGLPTAGRELVLRALDEYAKLIR